MLLRPSCCFASGEPRCGNLRFVQCCQKDKQPLANKSIIERSLLRSTVSIPLMSFSKQDHGTSLSPAAGWFGGSDLQIYFLLRKFCCDQKICSLNIKLQQKSWLHRDVLYPQILKPGYRPGPQRRKETEFIRDMFLICANISFVQSVQRIPSIFWITYFTFPCVNSAWSLLIC